MRRPGDRSARCRAVLAVAALYALLLQAFLAGLHPGINPGAPIGGPGGVICAEHDGGAPADDTVPCRHHACCVPAQAGQIPDVLAPVAGAVPVPEARMTVPMRRLVATLGARAPPDPAVSPRGPPVV